MTWKYKRDGKTFITEWIEETSERDPEPDPADAGGPDLCPVCGQPGPAV